jgi:hypothetical protein
LIQESRNRPGIILQIRIHDDDNIARAVLKPGLNRRLMSEVSRQMNHDDVIIGSGQSIQLLT